MALTRLEPGNATYCCNLGLVYEADGNNLQAVGAYQKALQLRPDYQKAKDSLSALEAKQRNAGATQMAAAPVQYQTNQQVSHAQSPFQQPQGQTYQAMPPQQFAYQAPVVSFAPNGQALPVVDNSLVWILAFVPLLGILTGVLLATGVSIIICVAINCTLMWCDEKKLKNQGYDTRYLKWCWLLVPVWIFKRVRLVGGGNEYAAVWVATFVLSIIASVSLAGSAANNVAPTGDNTAAQSTPAPVATPPPASPTLKVHVFDNPAASTASSSQQSPAMSNKQTDAESSSQKLQELESKIEMYDGEARSCEAEIERVEQTDGNVAEKHRWEEKEANALKASVECQKEKMAITRE